MARQTLRSDKEFSQFNLAAPPHAVPISAPQCRRQTRVLYCVGKATGQLDELEELEATFSTTTISPPSSSSSPSSSSLFTPPFWVNPTPDYTVPSPFYPTSAPSTSSKGSGPNCKKQRITVPPRLRRPLLGMACYHGSRLFVICFALGATILIPSAIRFSFVQYSARGLFRWIRNGFPTDEAFENTATEEKVECTKEAKTRWEKGVAMYSTLRPMSSDTGPMNRENIATRLKSGQYRPYFFWSTVRA
ncbi:hypothetical protein C8F04DRAFT_1142585 [Mycena alexandri]|uniref:Uncharacterized protein n=1 Tax=Mycena alexandri TaxID=1745969 RepID=A0AAD6S4S8_9AGAR|nr:hypothetical protein C8F04DRAFT_1142585 [Mycena alexandri]